ncbi:MAG: hypothetical protein R2940_16360 [Syntrophotaleaceae bacterium]
MRENLPGVIILSALCCLTASALILSGQDPLASIFVGLIIAMLLTTPFAFFCGFVVAAGAAVGELLSKIPTQSHRRHIFRCMRWVSLWMAFRPGRAAWL